MGKRYDEYFKMDAVSFLDFFRRDGFVNVNNKVLDDVRSLCKELDVSSSTLYKWDKIIERSDKPESEIIGNGLVDVLSEINEIVENETIQNGFSMESEIVDVDIFGIRFWGFVAKNVKIPNYSSMPLNQLKLKLGLKLIRQSGLVKTRFED